MRRKVRRWLAIGSVIIIIGAILILPRIFGDAGYDLNAYKAEIDRVVAEGLIRQVCPDVNEEAWLRAVAQSESGFNPKAKSRAGALGMAQFMPGTFAGVMKQLGVTDGDPFDPYTSMRASAKYFSTLFAKFGCDNLDQVAAAYNGGPGAVRGGVISRSTSGYASIIGHRYEQYDKLLKNMNQTVQQATQDNPSVPAAVVETGVRASFWNWFGPR